jgi:iron complex transport system ATP-binding protein
MTGPTRIVASGVGFETDGVRILSAVDLEVHSGELLALVGPNGAGKSTLLSLLSGDARPSEGTMELDGRHLGSFRHRELARYRAVLTQENQVSFPFTVREVVEMGRAPWPEATAESDARIVDAAFEATDTAHLISRRFTSLSGGEKARVSLARVLAQDAGVVFLDEPTAALDLRHQEEVMRAAARLASEGRAVVVVVHDLSLAAAYADRVAVIAEGRLEAVGTPDAVVTAERIERVYGLAVEVVATSGRPVVVPVRASV